MRVRVGNGWPQLALAGLLAIELVWASHGQVVNRPNLPDAYSSQRSSISHLLTDGDLYRTVAISDNTYDPGDLPHMVSFLSGVLSQAEVADYVTYVKHKETLTPNLPLRYGIPSFDGYDGGLLPLRAYAELKTLFPLAESAPDGRLREQLLSVPSPKLLGWLNVKYVLMDRVRDAWVDGAYYDLGIWRPLSSSSFSDSASSADGRVELSRLPRFATTAIGVISQLTSAEDVPEGTEVATLQVTDAQGEVFSFSLRAGRDTAEARYGRASRRQEVAHRQARAVAAWPDETGSWSYYTLLRLPEPIYPRRIAVVSRLSGPKLERPRFELRGLSLLDQRLGMSQPVPLSDDLRLVHVGDVKLYENLALLPRAFLVQRLRLVDSPQAALGALKDPAFEPSKEAVAIRSDWAGPVPSWDGEAAGVGTVEVVEYRPEHVALKARLDQPGLLVLTDAYYPGWTVWVDGQEQPLRRVDYLFRGVVLTAGEHRIDFRYEPTSFRTGLLISLASLLALTLGVACMLFPHLQRPVYRIMGFGRSRQGPSVTT